MATLKETVNDMVFKLRIFSSEVTRVSLEVGTKGQLGGQAVVLGVEVRVISLPSWTYLTRLATAGNLERARASGSSKTDLVRAGADLNSIRRPRTSTEWLRT